MPDPDKYARKLDNVGLADYGIRLKSYYKKLTDLKNSIIDKIISLDITDSESRQTSQKLRNALSNFDDAADSYINEDNQSHVHQQYVPFFHLHDQYSSLHHCT